MRSAGIAGTPSGRIAIWILRATSSSLSIASRRRSLADTSSSAT